MPKHYIQREVELRLEEYKIIRAYAVERGLGSQDFSSALRQIIREWKENRLRTWREPSSPPDKA